jgi:hypothetical protein
MPSGMSTHMRDAATQHVHEALTSERALDTLYVVLFGRTARGIMCEQTAVQFELDCCIVLLLICMSLTQETTAGLGQSNKARLLDGDHLSSDYLLGGRAVNNRTTGGIRRMAQAQRWSDGVQLQDRSPRRSGRIDHQTSPRFYDWHANGLLFVYRRVFLSCCDGSRRLSVCCCHQ